MEDDAQTIMDIGNTQLSKIYSKVYPPIPTPINVTSKLNQILGICKVNGLKIPKAYLEHPEISNGGDAFVGIEIELENYNSTGAVNNQILPIHDIVCTVWAVTTDSSLRNNGVEWVTKPGLIGKDVGAALVMLRVWLHLYSPGLQFNYRCGTHVHVNVRNFSVEQLINFVMLYSLFEDSLYKVSGSRYRNIFCVPLRAASSSLERLMKLVHMQRPTYDHFRRVFRYFKKYMAFNILPAGTTHNNPSLGYEHPHSLTGVRTIGTVEFRHHEGESDPTKLTEWVQRILDLHQAAQSYKFDDLKKLIFKLNSISNYMQFCDSIFTHPLGLSQEEIATDMYEGSGFLKELYLVSKGE